MALGLVLAASAAVLSYVRVDFDGVNPNLTYRSQAVWLSASTIFVTQEGFPSGRAILDEMIRVQGPSGEPAFVPRFGDSSRYSGLAELYAELAKSDAVKRAVLLGAPTTASYAPEPAKSPNGTVLPMIHMKGFGASPQEAVAIANKAAAAFRRFLAQEQARNGITERKRVEVVVISNARAAELFQPRSVVRPIFIFLVIAMIFVALAFVLENIRPRVRPGADVLPVDHAARARRTA